MYKARNFFPFFTLITIPKSIGHCIAEIPVYLYSVRFVDHLLDY